MQLGRLELLNKTEEFLFVLKTRSLIDFELKDSKDGNFTSRAFMYFYIC